MLKYNYNICIGLIFYSWANHKTCSFFQRHLLFSFFSTYTVKTFLSDFAKLFLTLTNNYATYFFNSETLFSFQRG